MNVLSPYLQIGIQARKLFFMDSRYPTLHLTVSWDNPSGEVDIHLTREFPDKPKIYGSIAKFTGASITGFLNSFLPQFEAEAKSLIISFLQEIKFIRPGWLGRKGYLIFWVPEGDQTDWITRFAHRHKKNKYRVYQSTLANLNYSDEVLEHLYDPAILHMIADRKERGWIQALRIKGRKRRRRVMVSLLPIPWSGGRVRWVAVDALVMAFNDLMERMGDSVFRPFIETLNAAVRRAYDDLRLYELGIERDKFTLF